MKTLLLTLVVVTIVCLDLGDSLICYQAYNTPQTCAPGENLCYTKTWCDYWCHVKGKRIDLGCAATCPTAKPGEDVTCCSRDKCNPHPLQRPR
uniref:Long neurotoxin 73 n=1 Tax=Drysdalia coronoides TaxID=66186 RepID=3L273_DRYCN|nr:RecName: Full=Long neurotoxin 73; Short=LNTX-73; Flags: Precursor [Drysdalia coronoides]ACR78481.1 putative long chain neurotoxin 73 [Drysdalia coronoides]